MSDYKDTLSGSKTSENITPIQKINVENYKLLDVEHIINDNPPPIEYIFDPYLPTKGIAFIYAAPGIGKTLFTMNLAYAIAQGGRFLKYYCKKPRKVLYVDGEMSYQMIRERLINIHNEQGELFFKENFQILNPEKLYPYTIPQMDTVEGQMIYNKIVEENNIEVIIFDNLSVLTSFDENKSHEWKPIQDWLVSLRSKGLTSIIVHHSAKDGLGYRGTSRMLVPADIAISLQHVDEDEKMDDDDQTFIKKFKVIYQKTRGFGGEKARSYEVNLQNNVWSFQTLEKSQLDMVVEKVNLGMSYGDIAKEMNIHKSRVQRIVNKARSLKRLP